MPYEIRGNCIYKKDGGAKVGCTKGDVHKYLAALHANANESVEESLIGEDYPTQFDINVFKILKTFKDRIAYCENNLKKIGQGSSRVVYQIDKNKVLKLAKNKKGIAQNETEIDRGSGSYFSSILAQVFDSHPDGLWVEMESAIPINKYEFRRLTNFQIEDVGKYLINFQEENNGHKPRFHLQQPLIDRLDNDEFIQQLREFVAGTDALAGDLGVATSYGIVRRDGHDELVLIDFGITTDIYKNHYAESTHQKNLKEVRRYVRQILSESLDPISDYKKWKRKNVTIRGILNSPEEHNGVGSISLGDGLYTAHLGNKEMARKYGKLYFVVNGRPKHPLIFDSTNRAEIWLQQNLYFKNYKDMREFNAHTSIKDEVLKMGYDGIEVKGREMVNFKPENVLYFRTEQELMDYYKRITNEPEK